MCAVNTDIDCVKYLLQSADEYMERLNKVDNSILASCPVINICIPLYILQLPQITNLIIE